MPVDVLLLMLLGRLALPHEGRLLERVQRLHQGQLVELTLLLVEVDPLRGKQREGVDLALLLQALVNRLGEG